MPRRNVWLLGIVAVVCLACYSRVNRYGQILNYAMEQIDHRSLEKVDDGKLLQGALEGMMASLDDHHSVYITPKLFQEFQQTLDQKFAGVGVEVILDPQTKQLTVATPLFGSPAYDAGVRPGDKVLRIDGKPTQGLSLEEASDLMRGKPGTAVVLTIQHEDEEKPTELRIVRAVIPVDSVQGYSRKANGTWDYWLEGRDHIGYVRITTFGDRTAKELQQALSGLLADDMKGLILDLRNNPGGLLLSAVDICRQFVDSGEIVTTRRRNGSVKEIYLAGPRGSDQDSLLPDFPMVVLVNKYSASASEIVAACLQDHGRAVIAGERTYGKGTVQEIIELHSDQGALKLTTASYWRPSGKNINRGKNDGDRADWGVVPDEGYQVTLEGDKLTRKLRWRREHDMAPSNGAAKNKRPSDEPEARFQTDVDPQLARAVEYVEKELAQRTQGIP